MLSPRSQQALLALPALRGVAEVDRRRIAGLLDEIALPKDAIVYQAGDPGDALYVVSSGAVDVVDDDHVIARYGPGEAFGESALVAEEPRAVTTRVALDAVLIVVPRDVLHRLFAEHPGLHEHVSAALVQRLRRATRLALARPETHPTDVVAIHGWRSAERPTFVDALASAIEHELGADVTVVTVAPSTIPPAVARDGRNDAVVPVAEQAPAALRERVASELAARGTRDPVVLLALDGIGAALEADVLSLASTVVTREVDGLPHVRGMRRVVRVLDRRDGDAPPGSSDLLVLPAEDPGRARALARLARRVVRRSVGVALGSGAAWGLAHIGVLDVLDREGIPVDLLAGASMGAIVGAHYALGFSPARMEEIATGVRAMTDMMRIVPQLLYLAVDFNVARPGLFAGGHFQRLLEALGPIRGQTFADVEIPFRAIATDVRTGARVELCEGDLSEAMRASFSAPWIFSPVRIGQHVLIDGGMSDPVPAETVRSMGADLVIGVNAVPPVHPDALNPVEGALRTIQRFNPMAFADHGPLPNSFDVVVRTLQIMQHELGNVRAGEADVLIQPDVRRFWVLEFWRAKEMIEQGRRAAEAAVPAIRKKLHALRRTAP